jgi:hypothetical protein
MLIIGLNAGPAAAGRTVTTHDRAGDAHRGIDFTSVSLERMAEQVRVSTRFADFRPNLNGMQYYFDTDPHRSGPEFGAVVWREKDGDHLKRFQMYRMRGWAHTGEALRCGWRYKWRISGHGPGYFNLVLRDHCFLGRAETGVRVHVQSWDYTRYRGTGDHRHPVYGYYDNLRGPHRFTGRV